MRRERKSQRSPCAVASFTLPETAGSRNGQAEFGQLTVRQGDGELTRCVSAAVQRAAAMTMGITSATTAPGATLTNRLG